MMEPSDKLKVLSRIWGNDRDGYVFLPYISGDSKDKKARRSNYHEGRAFEWPRERAAILKHIEVHEHDDLYFTPATFTDKRRVEQYVDEERTLWADLDEADPREIEDFTPTIAWESSPGRFQGIWILDQPRTGASWASKENHRLTVHLGADPSGWDSTQLLRVPGHHNHKPEYRKQGKSPLGKLLWDNGPRYVWSDFEDLPEVGVMVTDSDLLDEDLLHGMDKHQIWGRVRLRVSHRVREFMSLRSTPDGADRSETLWEIERELADAGCTLAEIVLLVRSSVWNKYAGRADELQRLRVEASKAIAMRDDTSPIEMVEDEKPSTIQWLSDVTSKPLPRPRWLVHEIWTKGGCGFISGAPKSYKSWMALDLAISVSTGTPFLGVDDYHTSEAPVLYLQEEDDLLLVMSRTATILESKAPARHWEGQLNVEHTTPDNARSSRLSVVWTPPTAPLPLGMHVQTGFIASDPGWQAWLSDVVREHGFQLVVIDTLGTTAGDIDTDRAGELMNKMLKPLKTIAHTEGCAIAVVHHNRKESNGNRAGQSMLGSVALHAWVDCAIYARSREKESVKIEREAKLAQDLQLTVNIPRMFANLQSGERALWNPTIELATVDQEEAMARPDDDAKPKRRGRPPVIMGRLDGTGKGPWTRERLTTVFGDADVDKAINGGWLVVGSDGLIQRADTPA